MGLDATAMLGHITGGTTAYLVEFLPIGLFVAGVVLALGIMRELIDYFVDLNNYNNVMKLNNDALNAPQYRDFSSYRKWRKNYDNDVL
jgi:hypothetical protein